MRHLLWIAGLVLIIVLIFYAVRNAPPADTIPLSEGRNDSALTDIPVDITPVSHATVVLAWGGKTFLIDPVGTSTTLLDARDGATSTVILVTDIHGDHLSTSTLRLLAGVGTSSGTSTAESDITLIVPEAVEDALPEELASLSTVLDNYDSTAINGFRIQALPMYNVPEVEGSRHPKGRGNGYLIERDGFRVYIAGDTGPTPEMQALTDIDIAFVPMNLPFTMSVEDAATAVLAMKPRQVYPYHYRGQNGLSDVDRFKELVERGSDDIEVILEDWYPEQ